MDEDELQDYFKTRECVPGVTEDQLTKLFKFLDANGDGSISVNELCMLLSGTELSLQDRLKDFSQDFSDQLRAEISEVFTQLDTEAPFGKLNTEELVQAFIP